MSLLSDVEFDLRHFIHRVENLGASQALTNAVVSITNALEYLADHLEASGEPITPAIQRKTLAFSAAIEYAKVGLAIRRSGWNGSGLLVKAQYPDENSKMTLPYLYIEYPQDHPVTPGARCPWLASQTDLMAEDWQVVAEVER